MRRYWVLPIIFLFVAIVTATGIANSVPSHHHSAHWTTDLSLSHSETDFYPGPLHWLLGCRGVTGGPTSSGTIVRTMLAAAEVDAGGAEEEEAEGGGEEEEGGGWDRLWDAPMLG